MELDDTRFKRFSRSETPLSLSQSSINRADVESKSLDDDRCISEVDFETNDSSHYTTCNAVVDFHESLSSREATPSPIETLHIMIDEDKKAYIHESDLVSSQPSYDDIVTESRIDCKKDLENKLVYGPDLQKSTIMDAHESPGDDCKVNFDFGVSASSFDEGMEDNYPASVHSRAETPSEEAVAFDFEVLSTLESNVDAASETATSTFVSPSGYVSALERNDPIATHGENHENTNSYVVALGNGAIGQQYGYMKERAQPCNLDTSDLCDLSQQSFDDYDSRPSFPHCNNFNFRDIIGFSSTSNRPIDNSSSSCVFSVSSGYISSETSQYCDSGQDSNNCVPTLSLHSSHFNAAHQLQ